MPSPSGCFFSGALLCAHIIERLKRIKLADCLMVVRTKLATHCFLEIEKKWLQMAHGQKMATKIKEKNNRFSKSFFQIDFRHTVFFQAQNRSSKSFFEIHFSKHVFFFHTFPQNRSSQSFSQMGFSQTCAVYILLGRVGLSKTF